MTSGSGADCYIARMKTSGALRVGLLGSLALACACLGAPDDSSSESIGSSGSPIEGGHFINDGANPTTSLFPLLTVNLQYSVKTPGVTTTTSCTGVIVSATQILTASHCKVTPSWSVYFYPTAPNPNNPNDPSVSSPTGTLGTSIASVVPAPGTQGCTTPATVQNCGNNGTFSDLAIITLSGSIPGPYMAAPIGPAGVFDGGHGTPPPGPGNGVAGMPRPLADWAVGTGAMNPPTGQPQTASTTGPPSNPNWQMEYVPVEISILNGYAHDDSGSIWTKSKYTDPGDSGGPLFEANYGVQTMLIGILSGSTDGSGAQSMYTSLENPVNNSWLQSQLVAPYPPSPHAPSPVPNIATFGASLVPN
jgi:hypothetical protein